MEKIKAFLKRKNIIISAKRYGIDALGAMAQGLFASLLIGTIISTIGEQAGIQLLVDIGGYAKAATGPAMANLHGFALQCPPLVLFSLAAVGVAANTLGGAGGPLAVLIVTIFAAEFGKAVSKETKIDIIVTPFVTIFIGAGLAIWWAPGNRSRSQCSRKCHYVGNRIAAVLYGNFSLCNCRYRTDAANQQCCNLCSFGIDRTGRRSCSSRMLCQHGRFCSTELPGK